MLWVDTETSGLSPYKNGIISLAGFIDTPSPNVTFSYESRPHPNDKIESRALEVNGYRESQIREFPDSYDVISTWESFLRNHVNPFDTNDKLTLCGYNIGFDMRFLRAWFQKHGNNYFHSYFSKDFFDVLPLVKEWRKITGTKLHNNKLATVAQHFDITGDFHSALDDIKATYEIYQQIKEYV